MEEVLSWGQKSRVSWLEEGEKYTKVFHTKANSNKRKNSIGSLLIGGSINTNQTEIRQHIGQFNHKLYTEECSWWLLVDGLSFDSILEPEASWLGGDFGEKEVRKVLLAMVGDKSGIDGFFMAFFQSFWDVLKMDIMKVLSDFHARKTFENSLNALFITLIPKTPSAIDLPD
jgi:hypothetical protein